MILLLGGTSETAPLAMGLAEKGYRVLVSTATDVPLDIGDHPNICRQVGRMNAERMSALVEQHKVRAIVDATHPYASEAHATAERVAGRMKIPCFRLDRPTSIGEGEGIAFAANHEEAAKAAFSLGRPVLLTTGSRNLRPYVRESRRTHLPLTVRVLPHPESVAACRAAGIGEELILAERGPFSVEQNQSAIRRYEIGVIVTKDSGDPGGAGAKVEAARAEGCRLIVIQRPDPPSADAFRSVEELIAALLARISAEA